MDDLGVGVSSEPSAEQVREAIEQVQAEQELFEDRRLLRALQANLMRLKEEERLAVRKLPQASPEMPKWDGPDLIDPTLGKDNAEIRRLYPCKGDVFETTYEPA